MLHLSGTLLRAGAEGQEAGGWMAVRLRDSERNRGRGLATFPLSAVHGSHTQPALCLCPDRAV